MAVTGAVSRHWLTDCQQNNNIDWSIVMYHNWWVS